MLLLGRPSPKTLSTIEPGDSIMRKVALAAGRLVPVVAVIALLVLALVAARASANSPSATISFAGNATLVSDPGPVTLTLHYSCLPPSPGNIEITLGEGEVISGDFLPGAATCDGRNHSLTVTVTGLFTPGTAAGQAFVENLEATATASDSATVFIR
jgi:hypothetical protein